MQTETHMNAFVIAVLVTFGITSTALAQQQRSVRAKMIEAKAKYGQTFDQCATLAKSRGYRLSEDDNESRAAAVFVANCIKGAQR
jgi:hypothetical protein